ASRQRNLRGALAGALGGYAHHGGAVSLPREQVASSRGRSHAVGTMLNLPLIAARVIHFASTVMVAGTVLFLVLTAPPDLRRHRDRIGPVLASLRDRLVVIAWAGLVISIVSGIAWLLFLVATISGSSLSEVISTGTASTFLSRTQFGHD